MKTFKNRIDLIASLPVGAVMAEVGVHRGYFACQMLDLPNLGHLHLVDPWVSQPGYNDPLTNTDHEANLSEAKHVLRGHIPGGRVTFHRMDSVMAALFFHSNDIRLDGAFIDASHDYESVLTDLRMWSKCLKPDARLMGHDFCDQNPMAVKYGWGVQKAVTQFCKETDWKLVAESQEEFPSFCLRRI